MSKPRVLVVDDHHEMVRLLADSLRDAGYEVATANGGAAAIAAVRKAVPDVVITDLRMEEVDGLDVLKTVKGIDPSIAVIIVTAFGGIESAVEAVKAGAFHYLTKPFRLEEVRLFVERAVADRRLRDENRLLRRAVERGDGFAEIVGRSHPMRTLCEAIDRIAPSAATVLLRGESGTGKELVARSIHARGPRAAAPFVAVNCTAIPETLLESELFGHIKGSFTGAAGARRGLFQEADGGTLFLDEIGDMPLSLQAKLLRVLEDGEVRPIGADSPKSVDVRIVAASHQELDARVSGGGFRADLYFRLSVIPLRVPPLRERIEDLPLLVARFLANARERNPHTRVRGYSASFLAALARHSWPGNVRELKNLVERLVVTCDKETLDTEDATATSLGPSMPSSPFAGMTETVLPLRQLEADYIAWAIRRCDGNKTKAAELLGIDVSTIHRREKERG